MDFGDINYRDIKISFDVLNKEQKVKKREEEKEEMKKLQEQLLEKEVENNIVKCKLLALERHHLKSLSNSRGHSPYLTSYPVRRPPQLQ